MHRLLSTAVFSSFFLLFSLSPVCAQTVSLSLSPPISEVLIRPGSTGEQIYTLRNETEPTLVMIRLLPFSRQGIDATGSAQRPSWIRLSHPEPSFSPPISFDTPFLLSGTENRTFGLVFSPPLDLTQQDYPFAVVAESVPHSVAHTSHLSSRVQLVSPLLLSVSSSGITLKSLTLISFDIPTIVDSFGPLRGNLIVKNSGTTFVRPNGTLTLTGIVGKGSYAFPSPILFPGDQTYLSLQIPHRVPPSDSSLFIRGFFLGRYTVHAQLRPDEGNIIIDQKITFYAIPWKLGGAVFLLVLFLLFIRRLRQSKNAFRA